jgi:APA family basic amino acid/polyamine antiporter
VSVEVPSATASPEPGSATVPGKRLLGAAPATALVVANMVGTGVFTTTGVILPQLGSPIAVLAVWAVSGVLALCGAAVYAELGTMMPHAGGEYVYLSRALHPAAGFLAGWIGILVGFATPTGAAALAFARYLHAAAPWVPQAPVALALIVALTLVHMTHVRLGAHFQTAVTALVVALIVLFVAGAAASGRGDWAHLAQSAAPTPGAAAPTVGAFAVGLVYVGYAYLGWNAVSYVAGEVRDPSRVLPRALVVGTAIVTVLYLALNFVFLWAVPPQALAGKIEVAYVAAEALFGPRGAPLLSVLVAFAVAGCASAMIVAGSRITVAMAEDGVFFRALGRRGRRGAPTAAVALQGAIAAAAALTTAFDRILVFVGFTLNLSAGAAIVAAFVLRWRQPAADRPYRALGWPVSGLLFLALISVMTFFAIRDRPAESAAGFGTLAAGGVAYVIWQRRRGGAAPRVLR